MDEAIIRMDEQQAKNTEDIRKLQDWTLLVGDRLSWIVKGVLILAIVFMSAQTNIWKDISAIVLK